MSARVAALYIDPRGPYPSMPDVDAWHMDRDATMYGGPLPIVAHPPCGPWGQKASVCTLQRRDLAPLAVEQVRRYGGVLEHPAHSKLHREVGLPLPGEPCDEYGGWTIYVEQVSWGHVARKPTWLYFVGVPRSAVRPRTGGKPTHWCNGSRARRAGYDIKICSKEQRRRTPPAFARWLVDLAAQARVGHSPEEEEGS